MSTSGASLDRLRDLEHDELVRVDNGRVEVAPLGRIFIRNVAMVFDAMGVGECIQCHNG